MISKKRLTIPSACLDYHTVSGVGSDNGEGRDGRNDGRGDDDYGSNDISGESYDHDGGCGNSHGSYGDYGDLGTDVGDSDGHESEGGERHGGGGDDGKGDFGGGWDNGGSVGMIMVVVMTVVVMIESVTDKTTGKGLD